MSSIRKQITVPYTADQMYDLVYDINSYSKFIPLCSSSEVHEEQDHQSRATMKIAKGNIGFEVSTVNTMEKGRSISINLENGPFKSLNVALGGLFKQLCDSMVESFRKQAAVRYGAGQA